MLDHMAEYRMPLSNFLNDEADRGIGLNEEQLQQKREVFERALSNVSGPALFSCLHLPREAGLVHILRGQCFRTSRFTQVALKFIENIQHRVSMIDNDLILSSQGRHACTRHVVGETTCMMCLAAWRYMGVTWGTGVQHLWEELLPER